MSQVGTITSTATVILGDSSIAYDVSFDYLDNNGNLVSSSVKVGSGIDADVALWSSPTAVITVANPPGYTGNVTLACPAILKYGIFGIETPANPETGSPQIPYTYGS